MKGEMKISPTGLIFIICSVLIMWGMIGCQKNDGPSYEWEWDDEDTVQMEAKPRILWIDAAANFPDFANDPDNIKRDLLRAKEAGFTAVVVDVRPTNGDVLFRTETGDAVEWLGAWLPEGYTKIERQADWDYLDAFLDAGGDLGLEVYASINTFVGGNINALGSSGMLYRDPDKKEWATDLLTEEGIVNTLDLSTTGARFLNPAHPEVREYLYDLLSDLARYDRLKGILLDRGRFNNLHSDFSDHTKELFEEFIGKELDDFPESVMSPDIQAGALPSELPPHFKSWMEFRTGIIRDFMVEARESVKSVNTDLQFGVYVGGWYSTYYEVGVNWASPEYDASRKFPQWATAGYGENGYADLMDIVLIGAYAAPDRIYGQSEWTVQGFCSQAMDLIRGEAVVIGGPDVGNGAWATSPSQIIYDGIVNSVDVAMNLTDGYFLFDMIHLKQKPEKWEAVEEGISAKLEE